MRIPTPDLCLLSALVVLGVGRPNQAVASTALQDTITVSSLEELVHTALEHTLGLRTGRLNVPVAEAGVLTARATFDPGVQLIAELDRSDLSGSGPSSFGLTSRRRMLLGQLIGALPLSTEYSVTVQSNFTSPRTDPAGNSIGEYDNTLTFALTQPLLRGFGAAGGLASVGAASQGLQATEARLTRLIAQTIAAVEISYWTLAQTEEEAAVAAESLERARQLLQRNEELRRLDKINQVSLVTAQVGVTSRRSALPSPFVSRKK